MAGIYIHIPFCKQACHYCDFHFSTNTTVRNELIRCLEKEIALQQKYLKSEKIGTIYFGGGTPSLLTGEELKTLLEPIYQLFSVAPDAEVTLEANPDDLSATKLREFKAAGINRLSIGIQSFHDHTLKFLNRAHDHISAIRSLAEAREAGFNNISLDLIYSIPGQTDTEWKENIHRALSLHPEHLSAYSLTIEEKTVFGRRAARGKLNAVEDDLAARQLEMLIEACEQAGLEHYEVSNFSKPGFQSRHNSSYWKQQQYLGVGPSAHSYNHVSRQFNVSNNHLYIRALQAGKIPSEIEFLSREDHVNEYLMTTLRTKWGSDLNKLLKEYGYDILNSHRQMIDILVERKLIIIENDFLKLTKRGLLLADKLSSDLFLIPQPGL